MKFSQILIVLFTIVLLSPSSHAHKRWFMPTDFTLSDAETVTVDFTASNNVFYVDTGMPLAIVTVRAPSGAELPLLNASEGKRRSSFDMEVDANGTYRISAGGPPMYFSSYKLPGQAETVRSRGPLAKLKAELPANATEIEFAESHSLIETFVTLGAETEPAASTQKGGLSLQAQGSHPNALYADETAHFVFALDGQPVSGLTVTVQAEGSRYRDEQEEQHYLTAGDGSVDVVWPHPGRYLLEASMEQTPTESEIARRYFSYYLTIEVMAP